MARRIPVLILLVSLLWFTQPVLAALTPVRAEIDPRLWQDLSAADTIPIIVRVRDLPAVPDATAPADLLKNNALRQVEQKIQAVQVSQRSLRAELAASGKSYRAYWIVNLLALQASQADIERLAARPDVAYIESDRAFRVPLETATGDGLQPAAVDTIEPGLSYVNAPALWSMGFKGQGSVVASADTGVAWDHPALKEHYRGWDGAQADHNYNWWDAIHDPPFNPVVNSCGRDLQAPCDDFGHGTHTTGTMVGDDGLGNQIGMAPEAKWIACRNMDEGVGRPTTYIECLQFFIAPTDLAGNHPDPGKRPDVINNSYSCPSYELCSTNSLHEAIEQVRAAGIFMSVSAGNNGSGCATITDPPGLEAGVFTVGAVDTSGTVASFSSRGPVTIGTAVYLKPDLVAPGVGVRSSIPPNLYGLNQGTSMAAPHVAGAVALLWSAFPALKGEVYSTEVLLRASATPLPVAQTCGFTLAGSVPNNTSGWGILDLKSAFDNHLIYKSYLPVLAH